MGLPSHGLKGLRMGRAHPAASGSWRAIGRNQEGRAAGATDEYIFAFARGSGSSGSLDN
jgi:hypothetical protein